MLEDSELKIFPLNVFRNPIHSHSSFLYLSWATFLKPSLDIVPFLRIIKSTGEPIKAPIEESRLVEAVRDV